MKDIWGDFGQVEERLAAGDLTQGVPGFTDYLLRKVRQGTEKQELAKYCVAQLLAAGGDYQVEALAQMEQGLNWFFTIVTPLAAMGAAQEWAKLFQPKKKPD